MNLTNVTDEEINALSSLINRFGSPGPVIDKTTIQYMTENGVRWSYKKAESLLTDEGKKYFTTIINKLYTK